MTTIQSPTTAEWGASLKALADRLNTSVYYEFTLMMRAWDEAGRSWATERPDQRAALLDEVERLDAEDGTPTWDAIKAAMAHLRAGG
jgi:hypothetical protein